MLDVLYAPSYPGPRVPNPFLDAPSYLLPDSLLGALDLCEFVWNRLGFYRGAMQRMLGLFLTDINIEGVEYDEKKKQYEFYRDEVGIMAKVFAAAENFLCYGNNFTTVMLPFRRFLVCPKCAFEILFDRVSHPSYRDRFHYRFAELDFHMRCPKCGYDGVCEYDDRPSDTEKNVIIKNWNPKEIDIKHDILSGRNAYYWNIPEEYKQLLRKGDDITVKNAPREVIKAIKHHCLYRFRDGEIHHMVEPTLAGMRMKGWGLSKTLINFGLVYYVSMLHRFNETLAIDYVVPTRIITPQLRAGSGAAGGMTVDPMLSHNSSDFVFHIQRMLAARKRYPDKIHVLPYPVQYGLLSGEAREFAPTDLSEAGMRMLMMAANVPQEIFDGTLQANATPMVLRLFQSTWTPLVRFMDHWLAWVGRKVSSCMMWEESHLRLEPARIVDDAERKMMILQLMASGVVPRSTAMKEIDLDYFDQMRISADEAKQTAQMERKLQEEMDQTEFGQQISMGTPPGMLGVGGGMPPGGGAMPGQQPLMPPGGDPSAAGAAGGMDPSMAGAGGGVPLGAGGGGQVQQVLAMVPPKSQPISPPELQEIATQVANILVTMDPSSRRTALREIQNRNESFHSIVTGEMSKVRNQARSVGQQIVLQQQGQGAPA